METELLYAYALTYTISVEGVLALITAPVKMLLIDCLKAAVELNHDETRALFMSCTPFFEATVAS